MGGEIQGRASLRQTGKDAKNWFHQNLYANVAYMRRGCVERSTGARPGRALRQLVLERADWLVPGRTWPDEYRSTCTKRR